MIDIGFALNQEYTQERQCASDNPVSLARTHVAPNIPSAAGRATFNSSKLNQDGSLVQHVAATTTSKLMDEGKGRTCLMSDTSTYEKSEYGDGHLLLQQTATQSSSFADSNDTVEVACPSDTSQSGINMLSEVIIGTDGDDRDRHLPSTASSPSIHATGGPEFPHPDTPIRPSRWSGDFVVCSVSSVEQEDCCTVASDNVRGDKTMAAIMGQSRLLSTPYGDRDGDKMPLVDLSDNISTTLGFLSLVPSEDLLPIGNRSLDQCGGSAETITSTAETSEENHISAPDMVTIGNNKSLVGDHPPPATDGMDPSVLPYILDMTNVANNRQKEPDITPTANIYIRQSMQFDIDIAQADDELEGASHSSDFIMTVCFESLSVSSGIGGTFVERVMRLHCHCS